MQDIILAKNFIFMLVFVSLLVAWIIPSDTKDTRLYIWSDLCRCGSQQWGPMVSLQRSTHCHNNSLGCLGISMECFGQQPNWTQHSSTTGILISWQKKARWDSITPLLGYFIRITIISEIFHFIRFPYHPQIPLNSSFLSLYSLHQHYFPSPTQLIFIFGSWPVPSPPRKFILFPLPRKSQVSTLIPSSIPKPF